MPKVSVIMCEYNTPLNILDEAVNSILNQTFEEFEFIIIDDSVKGYFKDYSKKYNDSRIKVYSNSGNKGLVYSLNKAITYSHTDYLVRMDTDDISLPNRIDVLYNEILSNPQFSVIGSSVIEFDNDGKNIDRIIDIEYSTNDLINRRAPVHPSVIMKKQDIINVGGYKNFNRAEDFVLWCELLLNDYRIKTIPQVLLMYRVSSSDYQKRILRYRWGEIKARYIYYRKMNANLIQILSIGKSIIAGLAPKKIVYYYHILKNKY